MELVTAREVISGAENVYQRILSFAGTDRMAMVYGDETLSYSEAAARMRYFAAYLTDKYGADKSPVVICGDKNINIIPCMLGVSLSGRAYVPIGTSFPGARLDFIIDEIKPNLVLDFTDTPIGVKCDILKGEELGRVLTRGSAPDVIPSPCGDDICYILFTSGSTGAPKGVEIRHRNLAAFLEHFNPLFSIGGGARTVLDAFSYSFDLSVGYIYPALYNGYTLYSVDRKTIENTPDLFDALARSGVEIIVATPSFIELCLNSRKFDRRALPRAERFIFCGETLTNGCALRLMERFPGASVINTYGPTETTVLVTGVEITEGAAKNEAPLPIGRPLGETHIRVANKTGESVPDGMEGELQIIGRSVGAGYFNSPELTARAFFKDAETGLPGYRTGDIGYAVNGMLYYCRREDLQVKLNGFRIELGDVERNLLRLPYISRAVVLPVTNAGRVTRLAACVVPVGGAKAAGKDFKLNLRRDLLKFAPDYMIPQAVIVRDDFPMSPVGKIDRRALSDMLKEAL